MKPHLPKLKGYSHTWQTTLMVMLMVLVSVALSLWFFWRSLYLPELQNHATYLAHQLLMIDKADKDFKNNPELKNWIIDASHINVITDPQQIPSFQEKTLVDYFTKRMATQMETVMQRPVSVNFKFKPVPILYIQDSAHPDVWLQEPVKFYAKYSPTSIYFFLLGIPLATLLTILFLVRQLNRPLKRLQKVAIDYITLGTPTIWRPMKAQQRFVR